MDIKDTTARLRRTFHYPTDESSNGGTPEVLDEEEQETLIHTLAEQNATTNQQYQTLLLALPILSSIPYLLALFRPSTFLVAVLGLTSLAATALLLLRLPVTETGFPALDAWARSSPRGGAGGDEQRPGDDAGGHARGTPSGLAALDQVRRRRRTNSLTYEVPRSPLERWLPYLNLGLCAILIMSGLLAGAPRGGEGGGERTRHHPYGWLGLGNLPAIVYVVVIIAKVVMASVDPEKELMALRYGYKGA